jgi:hypothetical protein
MEIDLGDPRQFLPLDVLVQVNLHRTLQRVARLHERAVALVADSHIFYDRALKILAKPRPQEVRKRDASTKREDYYKNFRNRFVLTWLITNLALIIGILYSKNGIQGISLSGSEMRANNYLAFGINSFVMIH